MNNPVFGEVKFNCGWETTTVIKFFGKEYSVVVNAQSYFESDPITFKQDKAFEKFKNNKAKCMSIVEALLTESVTNTALACFVPQMLLFQRDGGYALLFDDTADEDGGIVVCLAPKVQIMTLDEYL